MVQRDIAVDLLVVVLILVAVTLSAALVARHEARLGIIAHPDPIAPAESAGDDLADEDALRSRRESEWRHWFQLGNS